MHAGSFFGDNCIIALIARYIDITYSTLGTSPCILPRCDPENLVPSSGRCPSTGEDISRERRVKSREMAKRRRRRLGHAKANTLRRRTHRGEKKLTGKLSQRKERERGGSKALSFSTKVPRGIRARSVRTYFAIFSRHAISGMTNGGCAPFYPPSITPPHPSATFALARSLSLFLRQCRSFVVLRVECRVCPRKSITGPRRGYTRRVY